MGRLITTALLGSLLPNVALADDPNLRTKGSIWTLAAMDVANEIGRAHV